MGRAGFSASSSPIRLLTRLLVKSMSSKKLRMSFSGPILFAGPLKQGEDWHGFQDEDIENGYCMLDPTKVTILMPGVNAQGQVSEWGIPAAILTEFLDSRRVEIARTGDYTVLVLFSVGTSKGKWGSLLENLFEFKRLYDSEAPLEEALPELVAKYPHRYRNSTLKELSDQMHAAMIELNLPTLVGEACDEDFDPVLTPSQTYQKLLRNETEKIRFTQMHGRIGAVMLVPYPPPPPPPPPPPLQEFPCVCLASDSEDLTAQ